MIKKIIEQTCHDILYGMSISKVCPSLKILQLMINCYVIFTLKTSLKFNTIQASSIFL